MADWIKTEKEPPFSIPVLVYRMGRIEIGFLTTSYEWCDDGGRVVQTKPTHWMPMPDVPAPEEARDRLCIDCKEPMDDEQGVIHKGCIPF